MTWQAGEHRKVDASDIGLAPGEWPPGIEYQGYTFFRQGVIREDDDGENDVGDVLWGEYKEQSHALNTKHRDKYQGGGRRLTIFND